MSMTGHCARAIVALSMVLGVARADAPPGIGPQVDLPELSDADLATCLAAQAAARDAVSAKRWTAAARHLGRAARTCADAGSSYNLACAHALLGRTAQALEALRDAAAGDAMDPDHALKDEDLASLRELPEFAQIVESARGVIAARAIPEIDAGTLAGSADEITTLAAAASERAEQALQYVTYRRYERATATIGLWSARSWDRVAASVLEPAAKREAEWQALRALLRTDELMPSSMLVMDELTRRADLLRQAGIAAPHGPEVAMLSAMMNAFRTVEAEHPGENPWPHLLEIVRPELVRIAATAPENESLHPVLARLASYSYADLPFAAAVYRRLERMVGTERAREITAFEGREAALAAEGIPDFEATTLGGRKLSRAALGGHYTLIDFWATWCGPCRHELPNVVAAHEAFAARGLDVIGIASEHGALEDPAKFEAWCAEKGVKFPQVLDVGPDAEQVSTAFDIRSIPRAFLIGPDGTLVAAGPSLQGEQLAKTLERFLTSPGSSLASADPPAASR